MNSAGDLEESPTKRRSMASNPLQAKYSWPITPSGSFGAAHTFMLDKLRRELQGDLTSPSSQQEHGVPDCISVANFDLESVQTAAKYTQNIPGACSVVLCNEVLRAKQGDDAKALPEREKDLR